jgi:hypothetical protein
MTKLCGKSRVRNAQALSTVAVAWLCGAPRIRVEGQAIVVRMFTAVVLVGAWHYGSALLRHSECAMDIVSGAAI